MAQRMLRLRSGEIKVAEPVARPGRVVLTRREPRASELAWTVRVVPGAYPSAYPPRSGATRPGCLPVLQEIA
jgi:hypothetical protein